jgi:hypothetical protein
MRTLTSSLITVAVSAVLVSSSASAASDGAGS